MKEQPELKLPILLMTGGMTHLPLSLKSPYISLDASWATAIPQGEKSLSFFKIGLTTQFPLLSATPVRPFEDTAAASPLGKISSMEAMSGSGL